MSSPPRARAILFSSLLIGLGLGCGSDDGGTTSGTSSETTSESTTGTSSGGSTTADATTTDGTGGTDSGGSTSGDASSGSGSATSGTSSSGGSSGGGSTGGAAPTWDSFAEDFFAKYCVECHGVGDAQGRDYTLLSEVAEESAVIRCGVTPVMLNDCADWPPPNQFPVGNGPKPTEAERTALVEWIDAGLPP